MVSSTDRRLSQETPSSEAIEDNEGMEAEADVKIMEEQSVFDEIIIWGHEALPEDTADPYVRGIEEWISFSGQVC